MNGIMDFRSRNCWSFQSQWGKRLLCSFMMRWLEDIRVMRRPKKESASPLTGMEWQQTLTSTLPHVGNVVWIRDLGIHVLHCKTFRQDIQEIERIWTWGPFVKFLRATSMFSWLSISSPIGWRWCHWQYRMLNQYPGHIFKLCGAIWHSMVCPHRSREEFWQWNVQNFLRFAGSRLNQNDSLLAKFQWSGEAIQSAGPELLEMFLGNQQWSWDTYLPPLGMSVRSKVNRNTGFTPNCLPLGREVQIQMWCFECRWRWMVTKSQQTMHNNWSTN